MPNTYKVQRSETGDAITVTWEHDLYRHVEVFRSLHDLADFLNSAMKLHQSMEMPEFDGGFRSEALERAEHALTSALDSLWMEVDGGDYDSMRHSVEDRCMEARDHVRRARWGVR